MHKSLHISYHLHTSLPISTPHTSAESSPNSTHISTNLHTTITMISHIYLNTFHISLHISAHLHHLRTCAHISTQFCTFPHKLLKTWSRVQHVLSETKHLNCALCIKTITQQSFFAFKQPPTSHSTDSTYKYMQFDK